MEGPIDPAGEAVPPSASGPVFCGLAASQQLANLHSGDHNLQGCSEMSREGHVYSGTQLNIHIGQYRSHIQWLQYNETVVRATARCSLKLTGWHPTAYHYPLYIFRDSTLGADLCSCSGMPLSPLFDRAGHLSCEDVRITSTSH
jgi:hypothetical protein